MKALLHERASELRKNTTDAENRLWYFLRDRRLNGYKFTRQSIIGPYIADFVCRRKRLIIELDGSHHAENIIYDQERTRYLEGHGYKVLRFWNNEVVDNIRGVLDVILDALTPSSGPKGHLLPEGEKGSEAIK